jgi:ATP-dependent protease ClpP protease subunit
LANAAEAESARLELETFNAPGFTVRTSEDGAISDRSVAVVEYSGAIAAPMAVELEAIWLEIKKHDRFDRIIFRLNSPGGYDSEGERVIAVLQAMRERMKLTTLVAEHDLCASMCVALFIQGEVRWASPASAWMFHGASLYAGGPPVLEKTEHYAQFFKDRGVGAKFLDELLARDYLTSPGAYWVSGDQLAARSDIITRVTPNWLPATGHRPPNANGRIPGGI